MKLITPTLNGLASSLFLNVGFAQIAQKLDPVSAQKHGTNANATSADICGYPCSFTSKSGK